MGRFHHSRQCISRGTGILNNELYVGRLGLEQACATSKILNTGRRVSRLNPPEDNWISVADTPELRIIPQDSLGRCKVHAKRKNGSP